jgi:hypothetical protein
MNIVQMKKVVNQAMVLGFGQLRKYHAVVELVLRQYTREGGWWDLPSLSFHQPQEAPAISTP